MIVTPEQIRAARARLRLEQDELARRTQVSVAAVRRLEAAEGVGRVTPATLDGVPAALEAAGAEFIPDGVRHRPGRPDAAALFEDLRAISLQSAAALAGYEPMAEAELYDEAGHQTCRATVDSSALIAILWREPEADCFLQIIAAADGCFLSAVSLLVTSMVLAGRSSDRTAWAGLDALITSMPAWR